MLRIGGKGGGVGQLLAAVAAALLLRLFSGPGPELLSEPLPDDDDNEEEKGHAPGKGKVAPVTIRWTNINCSLSDKSTKSVSGNIYVKIHLHTCRVLQSPASYLTSGIEGRKNV